MDKKSRNSKQRDAVMEVLMNTDKHPNAEMVYEEVRKNMPNVSLGTVYRNLSMLHKNGHILKLTVGDGKEHFDGNTEDHYHFVCTGCNRVYDLNVETVMNISEFQSETEHIINGYTLLFNGTCKECSMKK